MGRHKFKKILSTRKSIIFVIIGLCVLGSLITGGVAAHQYFSKTESPEELYGKGHEGTSGLRLDSQSVDSTTQQSGSGQSGSSSGNAAGSSSKPIDYSEADKYNQLAAEARARVAESSRCSTVTNQAYNQYTSSRDTAYSDLKAVQTEYNKPKYTVDQSYYYNNIAIDVFNQKHHAAYSAYVSSISSQNCGGPAFSQPSDYPRLVKPNY